MEYERFNNPVKWSQMLINISWNKSTHIQLNDSWNALFSSYHSKAALKQSAMYRWLYLTHIQPTHLDSCSLHAGVSPGSPAARRSRRWWWGLREIWSGSFGTALRSGGGWSWGPRRPAAARSQASTTRWNHPNAPPSELWPERNRQTTFKWLF